MSNDQPADARPRRFLAALRRQITDRVPRWDIEFHAWAGFGHGELVLGEAFAALAAGQRDAALRRNATIMAAVADELQLDALSAPAPWWHEAPGKPAFFILPDGADLDQAAALAAASAGRFAVVGNAGGVPGADYDPDACARLLEDPAAEMALRERALAYGLERARRLRAAGCSAVFTPSDIADNHGPFYRPVHLRRYVLPFLARFAEGVRALGMPAILHSDGNLAPQWEELCASGIDAIQAIDPIAGMDLPTALDQAAGRVCLCGNLDSGLIHAGSAAQVAVAAERLVSACHGRGAWVFGSTNAVLPGSPRENCLALSRACGALT